MEKIKQNTNPLLDGYAYILARSQSYLDKDTAVGRFADNVEINKTKKMIYDFTTGAANDYYIVLAPGDMTKSEDYDYNWYIVGE